MRQGIAGLLSVQTDIELVAEAANGREAIQQFRTHRPDVTLMDLQMPDMGRLDAIIAIRGELPDARIVVFTQAMAAAPRKDACAPPFEGCGRETPRATLEPCALCSPLLRMAPRESGCS